MLQPERAQQVAELVKSALEYAPGERAGFLTEACAGDSELRAEVDSFLQFQDEASQFIEQGALHVAAETLARDPALPALRQIEGYEIISRIGVGGMGEVYLAHDTKLRRKVALKLVRAGMDTAEIVSRFRHEEQILASLNHPNIAQLYGAGVAAGDLPFFAMEYVEGVRIDEYCHARSLSMRARLELFRKVCAAVHYAHQHLVIHRDLKPSNILVTADGEPKLLDFGIAKLIEGRDLLTQMQTLPGAMTPDYASPEQIRGEAITTSSDVYSLGVLLYEFLTGQRPYRLKTRSADEIARAITDREPERPSTAIARGDHSSFDIRHSSFPKGDLDNIVLMALRKEPARRYASVGQFSEDIRRYLEGLPVLAHKDTVSYRAAKFTKRNKLGVAAGAVVLLTLLGGIIATAWQANKALRQAHIAAEERDRARKEATKAERINAFLQNILGFSDTNWLSQNPDKKRDATVAEALDEASRRAESELRDQPEVLASVRLTIGRAYLLQSRLDAAESHLRAAVEIRRRVLGPQHQDTAEALVAVGDLLIFKGNYKESESLFREAVAIYRRARDAGNVNKKLFSMALNGLGTVLNYEGDPGAGEASLREALENSANFTGVDRAFVVNMYANLAASRRGQGDLDGAIAYQEKALEEVRRLPGKPSVDGGVIHANLAFYVMMEGDYARSEALFLEALNIYRDTIGETHQTVSYARINLADNYYLQGHYPRAREEIDRAIKIQQQLLPEGHVDFGLSFTVLGKILTRTNDLAGGESYLRRALEARTRALKPGHRWTAETQSALGENLTKQSHFDEAEPFLIESHKTLQASLGPRDPRTDEARRRLVALYEAWEKPDSANGYR
jgi:eukaryotic-like serine/threonine-protein kinase